MAAASSNPAFSNSPAFSNNAKIAGNYAPVSDTELEEMYGRPAATPAETDRMSYEDTIRKVVVSFLVLLAGAAIGWVTAETIPFLWIGAAIAGFVIGLVNTFKKVPSRGLILTYALIEGVFVGGISSFYAAAFDGIVPQAVFGTLGVVGVTLALFASGKVRASKRATKVFLVAMVGYLAFSLISFVLQLTGVTDSQFGLRGIDIIPGVPLGAVIGVLVVIMAAYSLVLDFDSIQQGVRRGAPRIYGWQGAFGIMVTVVWLYLEILRLLAILRNN
jgi:uncharacterized YccA/Bax inhibitor family protein